MLKDILKPSNDYDPTISSNSVLLTKVLSNSGEKYLRIDNHLSEYDSEVGKKKVRDNLEVYSKEGVDALFNLISLKNDEAIKTILNLLQELLQEELLRDEAELLRVSNEQTRLESENLRVVKELERIDSESARILNELKRLDAESNRINTFDSLQSDIELLELLTLESLNNLEQVKETAETVIVNAELATNEANISAQNATEAATTAAQTEASIKQAETARVSAEQQRQTSEQNRDQAETERKQAEQDRATAEQGRVSAESNRTTAEQNRASAEQQRVTEFATLKQESETATTNANEAAEKANEAASGITDRLSETYPNFDAIKASGETNPNKIFIDAEKQTSYIYLNGEYVSVGGGNNLGASEDCYGIIYGHRANVIVGKEIIDAINACETISLLWVVKQNIEDIQWFRYVSPLAGQNSNGLRCFQLGQDGSIIVFSNGYAADSDLKQYAKSYRNVLSINRVEGIVSKMDEIGVSFTQQLDRLKQPDFVNSEDAISLSNGQYLYVAMLDMAIFNFDATILPYKEVVQNYLRTATHNGVMPSAFEHVSMGAVLTEKYEPSGTYNGWDSTQKGEDGYYISTCNTTGKNRILNQRGLETGKAKELKFVVEVIEGSFLLSSLNVGGTASDYAILSVKNIYTQESKGAEDAIGVGIWEIVIGSASVGTYGTYIKSVDVPVSVKFISQEIIPRGVLLRLKGDKIYDSNKVYDSANKKLVEIKSTPKKGVLPFDSPRYGNEAPGSSVYPLYIGEKYYNTTTGDIYEAGNLTTFKKLNDA